MNSRDEGRECPQCRGTGCVFVHDEEQVPVYRRPLQDWTDRLSHTCGMCGGDGWINPIEQWSAYDQWTMANRKTQTQPPED